MKINQKEFDKIVKKNLKSKFQNCFQCNFFPKRFSNTFRPITKQISRYYWNRENIEVIVFHCRYLNKRLSQSIKPFKLNNCQCFKKRE